MGEGVRFDLNDYERFMRDSQAANGPGVTFRDAVRDVMDTAWHVRLWLQSYDVAFTAADVAKFTKLIMDRESVISYEISRGSDL